MCACVGEFRAGGKWSSFDGTQSLSLVVMMTLANKCILLWSFDFTAVFPPSPNRCVRMPKTKQKAGHGGIEMKSIKKVYR